jgi:hypothetical protein
MTKYHFPKLKKTVEAKSLAAAIILVETKPKVVVKTKSDKTD